MQEVREVERIPLWIRLHPQAQDTDNSASHRIGVGIEGRIRSRGRNCLIHEPHHRNNPFTFALAANRMASVLSTKGALRSLPRSSVRQKNGIIAVATRCNSTEATPETTPNTLNWTQYLSIRRQRHRWETVRRYNLLRGFISSVLVGFIRSDCFARTSRSSRILLDTDCRLHDVHYGASSYCPIR